MRCIIISDQLNEPAAKSAQNQQAMKRHISNHVFRMVAFAAFLLFFCANTNAQTKKDPLVNLYFVDTNDDFVLDHVSDNPEDRYSDAKGIKKMESVPRGMRSSGYTFSHTGRDYKFADGRVTCTNCK